MHLYAFIKNTDEMCLCIWTYTFAYNPDSNCKKFCYNIINFIMKFKRIYVNDVMFTIFRIMYIKKIKSLNQKFIRQQQ